MKIIMISSGGGVFNLKIPEKTEVRITMEPNDAAILETATDQNGSAIIYSGSEGKFSILADKEIIDGFRTKTAEDKIID